LEWHASGKMYTPNSAPAAKIDGEKNARDKSRAYGKKNFVFC
jgi:hypothetical protein